MSGAATGFGADLGPFGYIGEIGGLKDFRALTNDDFLGLVDLLRQSTKGIDKSGNINFVWV